MILFPAIDLKDGACVRLLRGAMEHATVFNTDPAAQAAAFEAACCRWLHLVPPCARGHDGIVARRQHKLPLDGRQGDCEIGRFIIKRDDDER